MPYWKAYLHVKSPEDLHERLLKDIGEASKNGRELIISEYKKSKFHGEDRYYLELEMRKNDQVKDGNEWN